MPGESRPASPAPEAVPGTCSPWRAGGRRATGSRHERVSATPSRDAGHGRCWPGQLGLLGFVTRGTGVRGQRLRSVWKEAAGSQWGDPPAGAPVAPGGPARRKQSRGRGSRRRDWTHTRVGTRPASPGGVPWVRRGGPASAQRGRGSQAAAAGGPVMGNPPALPGPGDRLCVPTPATPSPGDEDSLGKGKPQRHSSWGQSRHHTHSLRHAPAPPQNRVARGSHYRALHKPLARPCTLRHTCVS